VNEYNFRVWTGSPRSSIIEFQTVTLVPKDTETTVLSFTNIGTQLYLEGIGGTGDARSEWFIYIDTVLKMKRRMTEGNGGIEIPMYDVPIPNASIVDVKVKHYDPRTHDFESELRYFR